MNNAKLIVIETPEEIDELSKAISDAEYIAYDTETTGVHKGAEVIGLSICIEESKAYYIIHQKYADNKLTKLQNVSNINNLLNILATKHLIMHNAVFDCSITKDYFGVNLIKALHTDTMILAHLLDENRRVGLKELSTSIFKEDVTTEEREMKESIAKNGGSVTKGSYELYKGDPYLIGKYGAKDALLTYKLFLHLVPQLYEEHLDKFFYEDESMPLLKGPTYELNTTGLKVDINALATLKKNLEAECLQDSQFINEEISKHIKEHYPGTNKKNTFNINSNSQLAWLLFGKLNLEFSVLTKEGKNLCKSLQLPIPYTLSAKREFIYIVNQSINQLYKPNGIDKNGIVKGKKVRAPWNYITCDKKTLKKLAPKHKWIERLLDLKRKEKLLSTYVIGIQERTQYGVIRPSFLQHGTTSGRYSSRNPNWQNLPRNDKSIKKCIVARPGKVFVGADYSQLEPRMFAYISGDKRLLDVFKSDSDFYSVIGMEVYDLLDCIPRKDGSSEAFGVKYTKQRDDTKGFALAVVYGGTARQIASIIGKTIEETQEDIDNYFEKFPTVLQMMLDTHEEVKKNGYIISILGRKRRIPEATRINKLYGNVSFNDLPYNARNLLNLAVNFKMQGGGASIVNRAAIKFHEHKEQLGIDCSLVNQVHDYLLVECEEADAEAVALLLQDAMENTTQLEGIRLEAIPKIGYTLADV